MRDIASALHRELSGERAHATATEITAFHRPPGGAGFHAAISLVAERLRAAGVADLVETTYPLDGETLGGHDPFPLAWEPYDATVKVVAPVQEYVVDLQTTSSCLAWWSTPTPPGGITAELIDVGTGETDEDFAGKDLTGKIVLIGHTPRPGGWMHAAREAMKRGAVGILSDYLFYEFEPDRTREGLPDAVQLLRLPNQRGQFDAWACSISYPAAQRLRQLLALGPVTLHADIQCKLFKGEGRNLVATIPGSERPDESVFFVAHCSAATRPCINCAAGPALMVEIARTLTALIDRGEIPPPRRSIKFLYLIEGLGSRAYFDANPDLPAKVKTAFVLDSVGHDQGKLRSVLVFYKHPDSAPSFVNDFYAGVMERAPKDFTWVFKDDTDISPVQFVQAPYTPWSDNHYWAAHGIPSPLIMSWPDKYFHTQLLTPDNADPRVFRRVGVTTALAAYEIADAGLDEARVIADEVAARATLRLATIEQRTMRAVLVANRAAGSGETAAQAVRAVERAARQLRYQARQSAGAVVSALGLALSEPSSALQEENEALAATFGRQAEEAIVRLRALLPPGTVANTDRRPPANSAVLAASPRKLYAGPGTALSGSSYSELLALVERMQAQDGTVIFDTLRPVCDELWNLIDGERTVGEIAEALVLQFDLDIDPALLVPLFEGLARSDEIALDA
jgi:aminopeptidase YwaD